MPRKVTQPRYFTSLNGYYIQLNRKRILLAKGPENDPEVQRKAWKEFHATMAAALSGKPDDDENTVYAVLNKYVDWVKENRSPNSYGIRKRILQSFSDHCGKLLVKQMTITHVEDWLATRCNPHWDERLKRTVKWGQSTKRTAVTVLHMALRWAASRNRKLISSVPISFKELAVGPILSRGEICLINDRQHELLLEYAKKRKHKGFYHLLLFLRATGARPAEAYLATAKEFDEHLGAWVIRPIPENQGRYKLLRRGKPRVVYIPKTLFPLLKSLNEQYPEGPIFRAENDQPWNEISLPMRFRRIRKAINRDFRKRGLEPPMTDFITAYSYRHTFATNWLRQGKNIGRLCELLNTSMKMLQDHYGHLAIFRDELRRELDDFTEAAQGGE
jgi:integrase